MFVEMEILGCEALLVIGGRWLVDSGQKRIVDGYRRLGTSSNTGQIRC
jgi:hypothetical protein